MAQRDPTVFVRRAALEGASGLVRGGNCGGGGRERDEEGVTLRVHLDTGVVRESRTKCPPMLIEELRVRIAVLAEKACRPFDVREEKRDRARGKFGPGHGPDHLTGCV